MGKASQIRWDEQQPVARNARRELPGLVTGYFERGRALLAKDPSPAKLHRLRLATKRLRYTLELFRAIYGPGLETRLEELRQVQQLLGDINDSEAARRLLAKVMKGSPQENVVAEYLRTRAGAKAQEFRKHWADVFDAPGRERWWTLYLATRAREHRA